MRWFTSISSLGLSGVLAAIALDATVEHPPLLARALLGVVAVLLLAHAVAVFRMRLRIDDWGLHVRNITSSFDLRWDEVSGFGRPEWSRSWASMRGRGGVKVYTRAGAVKYVSLWSEGRFNGFDFADSLIAELEAQRVAHSSDN